MAPPFHVHVSEREVAHKWPDGRADDSKWEDCLWCSVVEFLNDSYNDVPDTLAYAEKLRAASGEPPTGGSNFNNVRTAFSKLGIAVSVDPKLYPTFMSRLTPGTAGVATGSYANFPSGHRLRRWLPGFAGGHAVYLACLADGTLWWCDPLAPQGTYQGEKVIEAEVKQFMGSTWTGITRKFRALPATDTTTGDTMPALVLYLPGYTADIKPQSNVRADARIASTKLRTTTTNEPVVLTGTVKGDVDPANGLNVWYVWWKNGRWEYTATDNIINVKAPTAPPPPGYTQAQLDAAKAESLKSGVATGTEEEKQRLRVLLGL